ncbi:MAG: hypothetical protein MJB14_19705, partial [Spirochaetes bacterium]|nr:hypothetical protein [Spirochaetota bacterium]
MGSSIKIKITLLFIVLISGLISCKNSKQDQQKITDTSQTETVDNFVEAYGIVNVKETQSIVLDFPCKVEKIHIHNGEKVKAGQPILTLSYFQFENDINKKELELMDEQLELNKMKANHYNVNTLGYQIQKKRVENLEEELALFKKKIS